MTKYQGSRMPNTIKDKQELKNNNPRIYRSIKNLKSTMQIKNLVIIIKNKKKNRGHLCRIRDH